jgi:two-component system cell cycle sensor histidine kinase/response regulator CckA
MKNVSIKVLVLMNALGLLNRRRGLFDQLPPQTIMLVDDDPLIRQLGRELLEHLGFRVETAADAARALEVFQDLDRVDLVILDYHLPGSDGQRLVRDLRALDAGVRVLVVSGFLSPREAARLQAGGVQGIIYKPFRLKELQQGIRAALAQAAAG